MTGLTVGVVREAAVREQRVGLTPDGVTRLRRAGHEVLTERGAGSGAWFTDSAYAAAGSGLVSKVDLYAQADVVVCVRPPDAGDADLLRPGQLLIGLLHLRTDPGLTARLAGAKVTAVSLDGIPRTLSRAQSMDALSSQANVAGYKAALVAANAYGGFFPMFMTAAGTTRPAQVLVMGAGVAGLQAIGTARRLGALVTGYDIRDAARADVLSTGAGFLNLDIPVTAAGSNGGYARELTGAERDAQQHALATAVAKFDVIITTAQVPGRRPPVLISAATLLGLRPGSVVLDLAAGRLGGNVDGSEADSTVITEGGVTVIGAGNLPSTVPRAASTAYARNVVALLAYLVRDGKLELDQDDEITSGVLVTHGGEVVHPEIRSSLAATG